MLLDWRDHQGLAHQAARRLARRRPELAEDLTQTCLYITWTACRSDRYDPERGAPSTFLVSQLRSAGRALRREPGRTESLDAPRGGDDGPTLLDRLAAPGLGPEDRYRDREQARRLRQLVAALPGLERQVVVLRYGLAADGQGRTLEQVGRELGLAPERVRQLERKGLGRLRRQLRL